MNEIKNGLTVGRPGNGLAQMATAVELLNASKLDLRAVVETVAAKFRVDPDQIIVPFHGRGWNKKEPLASARLTALVLADEFRVCKSREELARQFKRSSGMPWSAKKRIYALASVEPWFRQRLNDLRAELKARVA